MTTRTLVAALALSSGVALLTGCVPNSPAPGDDTRIAVESSNDDCILDLATVPSGTLTFTVTNTGDRATEFYLFEEDGLSIVAEVENIAPGASRDLTVTVEPGSYFTECKPGMTGSGIGRTELTVTSD